MKFFLDANMPYSALEVFKKFKIDVKHARDVGLSQASDKEIMNYAVKNKSILITKDIGFANILISPIESHYGVVVLRLPSFFKASQFVNVLIDFLKAVNVKDLHKAITIVKLGRYRIRKFK